MGASHLLCGRRGTGIAGSIAPIALGYYRRRFLTTNTARRGKALTVLSSADPARVIPMQMRYSRWMDRRFAELQRLIYESIVTNDCFGITLAPKQRTPAFLDAISPHRYAFQKTDAKIEGFMDWLREQETKGILDVSVRSGVQGSSTLPAWSDVFVDTAHMKALREAYMKGVTSADASLAKAGVDESALPSARLSGDAMWMQPFHAERIGVIYAREYETLKTVLQAQNSAIQAEIADGLTQHLALGIAEGKNPMKIAREICNDVNSKVSSIGRTRARMIARTEVMRAHHLGNIGEYRMYDQRLKINIEIEVLTVGDPCDECAGLAEDGPYTLEEAEGMLPAHPYCRCVARPLLPDLVQKETKAGKSVLPTGSRVSGSAKQTAGPMEGANTRPKKEPKITKVAQRALDSMKWTTYLDNPQLVPIEDVFASAKPKNVQKFAEAIRDAYTPSSTPAKVVLDSILPEKDNCAGLFWPGTNQIHVGKDYSQAFEGLFQKAKAFQERRAVSPMATFRLTTEERQNMMVLMHENNHAASMARFDWGKYCQGGEYNDWSFLEEGLVERRTRLQMNAVSGDTRPVMEAGWAYQHRVEAMEVLAKQKGEGFMEMMYRAPTSSRMIMVRGAVHDKLMNMALERGFTGEEVQAWLDGIDHKNALRILRDEMVRNDTGAGYGGMAELESKSPAGFARRLNAYSTHDLPIPN